ncbi:MAG: hypothetical protein EBZ67_09200 [Chitinophagia bacterium]|nr:hypothetical protein [Chitinophagia bacterium]
MRGMTAKTGAYAYGLEATRTKGIRHLTGLTDMEDGFRNRYLKNGVGGWLYEACQLTDTAAQTSPSCQDGRTQHAI